MSEESIDVAIIIVGLNAKQHVLNCIESIREATWRNVTYEVIYIDNGSTDDSVAAVQNQFGSFVLVIKNERNIGYCPAANQGAKSASSRHLYFINDDTLVQDDAIALLVEYLDQHPEAGTVGSRLLYPDGSEQYSGRKFPNLKNAIFGRRSFLTKLFPGLRSVKDYLCKEQLDGDEPFEVDWVSAAGQIVSADDFDNVGGFAEDYYYWHEAVFCHRLSVAGKTIVLHPLSKVIHYEGFGSGPRNLKAQRFHIKDFHKGAYRAYGEYHELSKWSVSWMLVGLGLAARATALLVGAHLRAFLPARTMPSTDET